VNIVRDLYLGWAGFAHEPGCTQPGWEPQLKIDRGRRGRLLVGDEPHACPAPDCGHDAAFRRFTVRLVCTGCGVVHTVSGEDVGVGRTTTTLLGYGQQPLETEGVWLWPGEQTLPGHDDEPRDWLVTRTPLRPTEAEDVAGTISRHRTAGGHPRWQASAVADPTGPHGDDQLRWARRTSDLRTIPAAAAWIAAQYQPQTVEVTV
jgi:hypothetical protein